MVNIIFVNGSFCRAENLSPKEVGPGENVLMMARNEGWPFRGKPEDMAREAIRHINDELGYEIGMIPVIIYPKQKIIDDQGNLGIEEVVFQVIK